jgi:deoxyhypusine synthase
VKLPVLDFSKIKTYSVERRPTKVDLSRVAKIPNVDLPLYEFFDCLPSLLKAEELVFAAQKIAEAKLRGRGIIVMMGGHVVKCGLGPLIVHMMKEGLITTVAMNGAASIHDYELARFGFTSEDVEKGLETGMFGMVEETAVEMNRFILECLRYGLGLGEALGRGLRHMAPRYVWASILANAHRLGIPTTVHVAIGTDTIHQHPTCNGEALGAGTMRDFRLFAAAVTTLNDGGVIINCGSAVILPEVFLKALTVARNLGYPVRNFTAINMDMIQHYRPMNNVLLRPTKTGGTPISLTGHHEIMLPLLYAATQARLKAMYSVR